MSVSLRSPLGSSTTAALPLPWWAIEPKRPAATWTLPCGGAGSPSSAWLGSGVDGSSAAGVPVTTVSLTSLSNRVGAITSTAAATATTP